ncbi:MAG TPA: Ig-like domain-containing protein [Gammaproteobacteria bacterium]|nr:Ig-like domain-containing protein [Gammaproteobacteria bacterium]
MRRDPQTAFGRNLLYGLLLGALATLEVRADSGSLGVGITIVYHTSARANDGQVDINTRRVRTVSGSLSVIPVFAGQHLTYSLIAKPVFGTVSITDASTSAFTYTPAGLFRKGVDNFTFHVVDVHGVSSNTATEFVVQNLVPKADAGSITAPPDTPVSGTLAATPSYSGELLTFSLVTQAVKGLAVITDAHTGAFTYTPRSGNTGTDYFKFKVTDSAGIASNIAIESVTLQ